MQANDLGADEVVAWGEVGQSDLDEALVGNEVLDSPLSAGQTVLVDLGPDSAYTVGVGLCNVDHDGALVRGRDRVITVAGRGGVVVVPLHTDLGASRNRDLVGGGLSAVANHGSRGDIEDGVVAVGRSLDGKVLAHVLSANDEALESGMRSGNVGSSQDDGGLGEHDDVFGGVVVVGWLVQVKS